MTLAKTLAHNTLARIVARYDLREIGDPFLPLANPAFPQPLGSCRIFSGGPVSKLVTISLTFPPAGLDSHMIFAFTAPDSLTPHFTLDSVMAGPHFAFHIDLLPRVDLGANLAYIDAVFTPLTAHFEVAKAIEGLSAAALSPRQYAVMSPWMLAYRATEDAFAQIEGSVNAYLDHWFQVVENDVSAEIALSGDPAARDRLNRAAIFNPEVDPVWAQVDRLVGADTSARLRDLLREQELPE